MYIPAEYVSVVLQTRPPHPSPPLKPVLKEGPSDSPDPGPAEPQHLESCPQSSPSAAIRGRRAPSPALLQEPAKEAQGELTPWPSRWSSGWGERKSHRHPWHSPRTRVRDGSQDAPRTHRYAHTHTHTPKQQTPLTQTHTDTRTESHTTWHNHKECERVESQDTYRHPTTP